jgi:hypothetical protein
MTITVLRDGSRRFRFRLAVTRAVLGLHVRRHRLGVDELREVYLLAVFLLAQANWVNRTDDDMWRDVLDEAYRRGWTDRRVKIEGESLN